MSDIIEVKNYVLGFMFSLDCTEVLLIKKIKPEWQIDKINGVGGKVEKNEFFVDAMVREFIEETGIGTIDQDWKYIGDMKGQAGWMVTIFAAVGDISTAKTTTQEEVQICKVNVLPSNCISNLSWLIPLCLDSMNNDIQFQGIYY